MQMQSTTIARTVLGGVAHSLISIIFSDGHRRLSSSALQKVSARCTQSCLPPWCLMIRSSWCQSKYRRA
jgi:hypothetical protein